MPADLKPAMVVLFKECFQGVEPGKDYTWFVQGKKGIFDALDSLTAERASHRPSPDCATIAAHAFHIRYALHGANAELGGPPQVGDWESSWDKQTVSESEWDELRQEIRREYQYFLDAVEANEIPNEEAGIGFLAQLPHMAFHLGAIRQIMKIVP
jgi:hypothetical protein